MPSPRLRCTSGSTRLTSWPARDAVSPQISSNGSLALPTRPRGVCTNQPVEEIELAPADEAGEGITYLPHDERVSSILLPLSGTSPGPPPEACLLPSTYWTSQASLSLANNVCEAPRSCRVRTVGVLHTGNVCNTHAIHRTARRHRVVRQY